jgi:hypothetical protein
MEKNEKTEPGKLIEDSWVEARLALLNPDCDWRPESEL